MRRELRKVLTLGTAAHSVMGSCWQAQAVGACRESLAVPTRKPHKVTGTKQGLLGTAESRLGQEVVQKHPLFQVQIRMLLADRRKQACAGVGSGGRRAGV